MLLITCEHAGNELPEKYEPLFTDATAVLASHRGWDPGAWPLALFLAEALAAPVFHCHTSRLLIEVNRSLHHPQLFSEFTAGLSEEEKSALIDCYYQPYRQSVERRIAESSTPVLHISVHTFTPVWNGVERPVDVGLLFDPARPREMAVCTSLQKILAQNLAGHTVAGNEPYKGIDDGFTTYLRTKFSDRHYAGVEVEVNQKHATHQTASLAVAAALKEALTASAF